MNNKLHQKFAVIFFIHGGGFSEGSANDYFYGPDFLLEQNVILVTTNYRLGTFGFMSLNTKTYSGNMGMKDQQLALKWTYRNIRAFGGDQQRITLMGQSAGTNYSFEIQTKFFEGPRCDLNSVCFFVFHILFNKKICIKTHKYRRCIGSLSRTFAQITKIYTRCYLLEWIGISTLCIFRWKKSSQ